MLFHGTPQEADASLRAMKEVATAAGECPDWHEPTA